LIKEAIQYVVGLGNKEVVNVNGQQYATGDMKLLREPSVSPLVVHSLSGLIDYIKSNFDENSGLMIHVKSPSEVELLDTLNQDAQRDVWVRAEAMLPHFNFDRFYDVEDLNIKLQSCFVQSEDRDIMLKVVGNVQEENVKSASDDGVTQTVTARHGVAQVGNVQVPNPVKLSPYRTFVEVEQPQSEFIFRMQSGPRGALFEADGGAWKNKAMSTIQNFLQAALKEEVENGKINIIA